MLRSLRLAPILKVFAFGNGGLRGFCTLALFPACGFRAMMQVRIGELRWRRKIRISVERSWRAGQVEDRMKRIKVRRLLTAACVPAMGVMLALPLGGLLAGSAGADPTCYTGCTQSGSITSSGNVAAPDGATTSPSGIAFTGADIEEMAVIGLVATGVGVVLVRSSRRRTA